MFFFFCFHKKNFLFQILRNELEIDCEQDDKLFACWKLALSLVTVPGDPKVSRFILQPILEITSHRMVSFLTFCPFFISFLKFFLCTVKENLAKRHWGQKKNNQVLPATIQSFGIRCFRPVLCRIRWVSTKDFWQSVGRFFLERYV